MSPDATDFLYPFIEGDEHDAGALLADLAGSAGAKAAESYELRARTIQACDEELDRLAGAMAERFAAGGTLFTAGNGGSSTDAATLAGLFEHPPWGRPLPARSLVADHAIVTALANDVGFELVFSRQLIAYGRGGDMVIGFSTSGDSTNLVRTFEEGRRRGLLTAGLAGYEGGQMASCGALDCCLVVRSGSIHRIQEAQAALGFELWQRVQQAMTP